MHGRVVGALVDAENQSRDIRAGRRSRDDDLLGTGGDVLGGILRLGEATGGLDHDVDTELAPGEVRGVALLEHADGLAVDDDLLAVEFDGGVEAAGDGVVLEQVSEGLVIGEVVDRDDLEVTPLRQCCAEEVAADAAEPVDPNLDAQFDSSFSGVTGRSSHAVVVVEKWPGRGPGHHAAMTVPAGRQSFRAPP